LFSARIDDDIELRLLELRHAEALFALVDENRERLRPWFPWLEEAKTPKDSESFIRGGLEQFAKNDGFQAGIWFGGELAGVVGLHYLDPRARRTEIGYWLGKAYEGKGIMTRTCRFLCAYLFGELALNRVEIRCAVPNRRSRAIPERLGFTQEGILRAVAQGVSGYEDQVVYGILAREWT
jgi:ribosomal-protein-serine acetyltransferase